MTGDSGNRLDGKKELNTAGRTIINIGVGGWI